WGGGELSRDGDAVKTIAKQAAKSFLRYLVATFGILVVAITAAAIPASQGRKQENQSHHDIEGDHRHY
ncbi:MAG: hypothetical protein QXI12_07480, partial [Candidatus Methanomethyliaceae archaeon]